MKYKVILYNIGGTSDVDESAGFTFYTLNSALECTQAWSNKGNAYKAHLWDGNIWRVYE